MPASSIPHSRNFLPLVHEMRLFIHEHQIRIVRRGVVGSGIIETIHTGCMRQSRPRFATPFWTYNLNGTKSAQQFFQSPVCNARTIFRHF